jgi:hypothetical protein
VGAKATSFGVEGFARLFEGEGAIFTTLKRGKRSPQLRLQMASVDADVIEAVHAEFGGSVCSFQRKDRPRNRVIHQWVLQGVPAAELAEAMLPWLFRRRSAQVEEALEEWRAHRE